MSLIQVIVLGIVQGITEFLPVSSSGHLVLTQSLFGWPQGDLLLDTILHLGTLTAVFFYFGKDIIHIKFHQLKAIVIGSIPIVVVGLIFRDVIEHTFFVVSVASTMLIVTGLLNMWTDSLLQKNSQLQLNKRKYVECLDSLIIGVFQAFAVLPGLSRSGTTIFACLIRGYDRETAFRFSFLLVIPAILGASLLQASSYIFSTEFVTFSTSELLPLSVGFVTSCFVGFGSLSLFRYVIEKSKMNWFGVYCIFLGILTLIAGFYV